MPHNWTAPTENSDDDTESDMEEVQVEKGLSGNRFKHQLTTAKAEEHPDALTSIPEQISQPRITEYSGIDEPETVQPSPTPLGDLEMIFLESAERRATLDSEEEAEDSRRDIKSAVPESLGGAVKFWHRFQHICDVFYNFIKSIDVLRPPVKEGYKRLKWRCVSPTSPPSRS